MKSVHTWVLVLVFLMLAGSPSQADGSFDFMEQCFLAMPSESAAWFKGMITGETRITERMFPTLYEFDQLLCWTAHHWGREDEYDRSWLSRFPEKKEDGVLNRHTLGLMMYYATFLPDYFLQEEINRIGEFHLPSGLTDYQRSTFYSVWTEFVNLQLGRVLLINLEKGGVEWVYDPEIAARKYQERIGYIRESLMSWWHDYYGR